MCKKAMKALNEGDPIAFHNDVLKNHCIAVCTLESKAKQQWCQGQLQAKRKFENNIMQNGSEIVKIKVVQGWGRK